MYERGISFASNDMMPRPPASQPASASGSWITAHSTSNPKDKKLRHNGHGRHLLETGMANRALISILLSQRSAEANKRPINGSRRAPYVVTAAMHDRDELAVALYFQLLYLNAFIHWHPVRGAATPVQLHPDRFVIATVRERVPRKYYLKYVKEYPQSLVQVQET